MRAEEIEEAVSAARLMPLRLGAAELFTRYVDLLVRWNARLNLTAIREPSQIVRRHLVECMQCAQALPEIQTLLDFGSGAGLPGIPIAIIRPEVRVVLGESQSKKAAFLREAVRSLSLNAQIYDRRIEKMAGDVFFDAVTLRAVDRMEDATQTAIGKVTQGGWLVVFSTTGTEDSLRAALPDLKWERRIPSLGLDTGLLIFGRKPCST